MIELRQHLYESLLDDEENLINSNDDQMFIEKWAELTGNVRVSKISSKYDREYKIERNGKLTVAVCRPRFTGYNGNIVKMSELFPAGIEFKTIKNLILHYKEISDLYDFKSYSCIPDCVESLFIDLGPLKTPNLSFKDLRLEKAKDITIRIFEGMPQSIDFSLNNHYNRVDINIGTDAYPANLEAINNLNCDTLVIHGGVVDNTGTEYTKNMSVRTSNNPSLISQFEPLYGKFMKNNKVDRLLVCKYNRVLYEVIKSDSGHFKLEKTKN